MIICKNIKTLKKELNKNRLKKKITFVPTMGALHDGHLSLVKRSNKKDSISVVSIFINPKQFGFNEDYKRYPIETDTDLKKLKRIKANLVFIPNEDEIMKLNISRYKYDIKKYKNILCDKYRPDYLPGVADIIIRLFSIIDPDISYFGEKDFQQYIFVRQLLKNLGFKSKVRSSKTIREKSGLAMSSRNQYLSNNEKLLANNLYKVLKFTKKEILSSQKISTTILKYKKLLLNMGFTSIDYFEIRTDGLEKAKIEDKRKRLFIAANIGKIRLIDNLKI
jgi:pantoate--beta-alanine ligase